MSRRDSVFFKHIRKTHIFDKAILMKKYTTVLNNTYLFNINENYNPRGYVKYHTVKYKLSLNKFFAIC